MNGTYIGHLARHDPVLSFLRHELQSEIEGATDTSSYRVFKLNGSNDVYLYQDRTTGKKLIGKFFRTSTNQDVAKADAHLTREFDSLCMMRGTGLTGSPHNVVKPLGFNHALNALLITECFEGKLLSVVMLEAIRSGDSGELYAKLTALAYFLSQFHNRTATREAVDFQQDCNYMDTLIARLLLIKAIGHHEVAQWHGLRDQWRCLPKMWQDQQVYVHGDATPDNFMCWRSARNSRSF